MAVIRLGADDQAALGVPPEISVDINRLRMSEMRAIARAGINPETFGEQVQAGDLEAINAAVWLAARRAGSTVTLEAFDFELTEAQWDNGDQDGRGEAPAPQGADSSAP